MFDDDAPFDFIEDVPAKEPEPCLPFIWAGYAVTFDPTTRTLTVPLEAAEADLIAWVNSICPAPVAAEGEVIDAAS